jgi:hypothetical protein
MTRWISAPDALAIVVSHEVAPDLAKEKILAAIKDRKLPARARMVNFDGEDCAEVEILPMSFWEVADPSIDFEEATARSINILPSIPPLTENVRDLEFSEHHLFKLWPKLAEPNSSGGRPPEYDWDKIREQAFNLMRQYGIPGKGNKRLPTQKALLDLILEYCSKTYDRQPDSGIKQSTRLPQWIKDFRSETTS